MKLNATKSVLAIVLVIALNQAAHGKVEPNRDVPKPELPPPAKKVRYAMPILIPVQPTAEWSGYVWDLKLRAAAPKADHFVRDAMAWQKLWTAWQREGAAPEVNFEEEVLLVFTAPGPNVPQLKLYNSQGHVTGTVGRTCRGGPGFGYRIIAVPRKEIKSFFGAAIK